MSKYRHELKYVMPESELLILEKKLSCVMSKDPHADNDGKYTIRSVYFDDYMRTCYRENEAGIDPREKLRIRMYNQSKENISLEKKCKSHCMTKKYSCSIDESTCSNILQDKQFMYSHREMAEETSPLLAELYLRQATQCLRPVVIVEYIRTPYISSLGNTRITIDRNITASKYTGYFFEEDIPCVSVLPTNMHILEIKYDDYLPTHIRHLIGCDELRQRTFSKFYLGCKALEGNLYDV